MKHQKGFGCFSWFLRVGWEGLGKLKMKHETGVGCFMVHKSMKGFRCFMVPETSI